MARCEVAPRQVQVLLEEAAQLSLPQSGGDRGREDDALVEVELQEERQHLLRPQDLDHRLRDLPRLDLVRGVAAEPLSRAPRLVEGADEVLADVVDRLRREVAVLRLEQPLDVARPDVLEALRRERRREERVVCGR
ncbi:MAG TPA: hypothetical protein VFP65_29055 [Anaeromyxobacteraceae bacterium]|nr:hypothetical protein [Anaeromyxobacteraceae bacterium]